MQLQNKVALVTGAATGIGKAIAIRFAREGAKVVIDFVGKRGSPASVEKEIADSGGQFIGVAADVSRPDQVANLIDSAVKAFGRLDIVVNNAGIEKKIAFADYPLDELQKDSRRQPDRPVSGCPGGRSPDDPARTRRPHRQHLLRP